MNSANKSIPVVILAGGYGTRLGQETLSTPKPMVRIGEFPILLHLMSHYLKFGFSNFVILGGYKCEVIKSYFDNFSATYADVGYSMQGGQYERSWSGKGADPLGFKSNDWTVKVIDTGLNTLTSERLQRAKNYITADTFMCTYGDGLSTIDLNALLEFHSKSQSFASLTAFHPPSRFGEIEIDKLNLVSNFSEKPLMNTRVNGGFFVFERDIFSYTENNFQPLESGVLEVLSKEKKLSAFESDAWWQMMDTPRELQILNELWMSGDAPWQPKV
jgi:glucose-1-phosphate cytidylyltransferase